MTSIDGRQIELNIVGIGIVFYSPKFTQHIVEGEDYFTSAYMNERDVQSHIQNGTIVGFSTGSPGCFLLKFHCGYPEQSFLDACDFKLRLGLRSVDGKVYFRDLYDLMDWHAECPESQSLELEDGIYDVTLCSNRPEAGCLGERQEIHVYLCKLDEFPRLSNSGIPTLCT